MQDNGLLMLDFETDSGNQYVYDAVTNRVFFTPPPMREMIRDFKTRGREEIVSAWSSRFPANVLKDYHDQIRRWVDIDKAFFSEQPVVDSPVSEEGDRHARRWHRSPHLVIVVTNDCNLACKYCLQDTVRKAMTIEVAKSGIDRFLQISANTDEKAVDRVTFGFYGGEPLLEFDLIRKCVDYVNSRVPPSVRHLFFITTNGTLLTEERTEFLARHDFHVHVSLDGPRQEHDRNRVTKSGHGTFDTVFGNLMRLREKHTRYYNSRIRLVPTFDYKTDIRTTVAWFDKNKHLLPRFGRVSMARGCEKTCSRFSPAVMQGFKKRIEEVFSTLKNMLASDTTGQTLRTTLYECLESWLSTMADRRHRVSWQTSRRNCWPGVSRLALYPDGRLGICEKVEGGEPIGDMCRGIDLTQVGKIVNDYGDWVKKRDCHSCIAQHGCDTCYINTMGMIDPQFTCEGQRKHHERGLRFWYSVFESNPVMMVHMRRGRKTILDSVP